LGGGRQQGQKPALLIQKTGKGRGIRFGVSRPGGGRKFNFTVLKGGEKEVRYLGSIMVFGVGVAGPRPCTHRRYEVDRGDRGGGVGNTFRSISAYPSGAWKLSTNKKEGKIGKVRVSKKTHYWGRK